MDKYYNGACANQVMRQNGKVGDVSGVDAAEECNRLDKRIDELKDLVERLKLEAQIHSGEDRGHKDSLLKCYQAVGAQKGDWNGERPVIEYVDKTKAQLDSVLNENELLKRELDAVLHTVVTNQQAL